MKCRCAQDLQLLLNLNVNFCCLLRARVDVSPVWANVLLNKFCASTKFNKAASNNGFYTWFNVGHLWYFEKRKTTRKSTHRYAGFTEFIRLLTILTVITCITCTICITCITWFKYQLLSNFKSGGAGASKNVLT